MKRLNGWTNGQTDGWTDGWMDGRTLLQGCFVAPKNAYGRMAYYREERMHLNREKGPERPFADFFFVSDPARTTFTSLHGLLSSNIYRLFRSVQLSCSTVAWRPDSSGKVLLESGVQPSSTKPRTPTMQLRLRTSASGQQGRAEKWRAPPLAPLAGPPNLIN